MVCAMAAQGGHLAVLKWAREQHPPCPWDGRTFRGAHHSPNADAETRQYVLDNECPTAGQCRQSDNIYHIDTVISHTDTVILWSSPISILSSSISILSSCQLVDGMTISYLLTLALRVETRICTHGL